MLSANCQGLRDRKKRLDVISYYKDMKVDTLLQDTHLIDTDEKQINELWDGKFIINGKKTNSRGTAILFSNNFEYTIQDIQKDADGNLLVVNIEISDMKIKIINI